MGVQNVSSWSDVFDDWHLRQGYAIGLTLPFKSKSEKVIRKYFTTKHTLHYLAKKSKNNMNIENYRNAMDFIV